MTDHVDGSPAKAGAIAQKLVAILEGEDSETRRRAIQAAMVLLGDKAAIDDGPIVLGTSRGADEPVELGQFFNRDEALKPSDYAQLCAAYHFSKYGTAPFSVDELRAVASEAGVVLPDRLDMTLTQAAKNGKKLFQSAGKGQFKPTASAGLAFKERWNVKPGRGAKSASKE